MTLDEVSALVAKIKSTPIEYVIMETKWCRTLIKYTNHSKRLEKHKKNLRTLEDFKEIYDAMTKEENNNVQ